MFHSSATLAEMSWANFESISEAAPPMATRKLERVYE